MLWKCAATMSRRDVKSSGRGARPAKVTADNSSVTGRPQATLGLSKKERRRKRETSSVSYGAGCRRRFVPVPPLPGCPACCCSRSGRSSLPCRPVSERDSSRGCGDSPFVLPWADCAYSRGGRSPPGRKSLGGCSAGRGR